MSALTMFPLEAYTAAPATKTAKAAMVRVQLVKERTMAYETPVTGPADLASACKTWLVDEDRERFLVLHLDSKMQVLSVECVAVGTLNATLVHPREVFKAAILANAAFIALAHNHPSGNVTPSPEDVELTRQLCEAGKLLGIGVLDHLIVGSTGDHTSLRHTMPALGWHGC